MLDSTYLYLCAEARHAVGAWAGLRQALCQQSGSKAVVRYGQRSVVLQQVPRAAAFPMVQAGRGGEGKQTASGLRSLSRNRAGDLEKNKTPDVLHFQLLAVALW